LISSIAGCLAPLNWAFLPALVAATQREKRFFCSEACAASDLPSRRRSNPFLRKPISSHCHAPPRCGLARESTLYALGDNCGVASVCVDVTVIRISPSLTGSPSRPRTLRRSPGNMVFTFLTLEIDNKRLPGRSRRRTVGRRGPPADPESRRSDETCRRSCIADGLSVRVFHFAVHYTPPYLRQPPSAVHWPTTFLNTSSFGSDDTLCVSEPPERDRHLKCFGRWAITTQPTPRRRTFRRFPVALPRKAVGSRLDSVHRHN